ncbi:MAG: NAD(P)-binding domain-containing protein, partial [Pseudomonadota bacterium]
GQTLRAGLIGEHIQKTRLPAALQIMCDDAGFDLAFELIDTALLANFDFDRQVAELIEAGWTGVTVTHPFKIDAARFAGDGMSGEAADLGAANTLVFDNPLKGFNTDYTGFLGAWRHIMGTESPGRVAMAGAGGVAQAIGPALIELGARKISVWDVAPEKAQALVDKIGPAAEAVPAQDAPQAVRQADGLVNATALGMAQYPSSSIASALMGSQRWAFDAVYTPTSTEFLMAAAAAGLKTLSGFDLFRHMAIGSFEAYTGIAPDVEKTLATLAALKPD